MGIYDPGRWFHSDDPEYDGAEPDPDYLHDLAREREWDERHEA